MEKIKVAFFIPELAGGGAEKVMATLANNLDRKTFTPSMVIYKDLRQSYSLSPDIPLTVLKPKRARYTLFYLAQFLRREKPDILFSAMWQFNLIAILAKIVARVQTRVIVSAHNNPSILSRKTRDGWVAPIVFTCFYTKADRVVGVSKGVVEDLHDHYRVPRNKLQQIYNPIVDEQVLSQQFVDVNHLWFNTDVPVILSAGRLTKQKGYPNLLHAFARVRGQLDARLVILGDGEELHKLEDLAAELHITDFVNFAGFQQNPFSYMHLADCFVLSSLFEGFGMVLVEAMACGAPVVSTRCDYGPEEIITDGINGLLVPVEDEIALAEAIIAVLSDKKLAEKLAENGKRRAMDFSVVRITQEYEKMFKDIIQG